MEGLRKKRIFACMFEVNRHIEILLLSHDCVILPGFGGFMAHHVEARHDSNDDVFVPPIRTIGFNPNLTINDSLLAQSYVESYDLSYPEALKRIENEVEAIRKQIDSEGFVEFPEIGTISRNLEGQYKFEPLESGIISPDYYGLAGFEIIPLENSAKHVNLSDANRQTGNREDLASDVQSLKAEDDPEKLAEVVRIPMKWIRVAAAVLITIMTVFLLPEQIGNHPMEASSTLNVEWMRRMMPQTVTFSLPASDCQPVTEDDSSTEQAQETEKTTEDIEEQEDVKVEATEVEETRMEPQEEEPKAEQTKDSYYCVVLASMVSEKNGKDFIRRLSAQGYDKATFLKRPSGNKIVYGAYATENEAYNMKRQLSRLEETKDCWVTKIQP